MDARSPGTLALWVLGLVVSLCTSVNSADAQAETSRIEEVRRSEPVGVSQLALRAATIRRNGHVAHSFDKVARLSLSIPTEIQPPWISVELRDDRDIGYFMRPSQACRSGPACEYSWPSRKLDELKLPPTSLWALARIDEPAYREWILPVCLCPASEIDQQDHVQLVFVASRAITYQFTVSDQDGAPVLSDRKSNHVAGLPVIVEFDRPRGRPSAYNLTLHHSSSARGAVERFADTYRIVFNSP
jgi:hypothetical protein